jgi:hypothetical protein
MFNFQFPVLVYAIRSTVNRRQTTVNATMQPLVDRRPWTVDIEFYAVFCNTQYAYPNTQSNPITTADSGPSSVD